MILIHWLITYNEVVMFDSDYIMKHFTRIKVPFTIRLYMISMKNNRNQLGAKENKEIMMKKQYKNITVKLTVVTMLGLVLITGCSSSSSPDTNKNSQNATEIQSSTMNSSEDSTTQVPLVVDSESESATSDSKSSSDTEAASFETYFNLLGTGKQDFINTMNEQPNTIDEGGMEFEKAGIRVWLHADTGTVSQMFFESNDIDFNGARIGDKIETFKTAFGEPISDNNGDMHFKYKTGYVSVNYDTKTEVTSAVYLLSEDF